MIENLTYSIDTELCIMRRVVLCSGDSLFLIFHNDFGALKNKHATIQSNKSTYTQIWWFIRLSEALSAISGHVWMELKAIPHLSNFASLLFYVR